MEISKIEVQRIEDAVLVATAAVKEVDELQLLLIGGGTAFVDFA